MKLIYKNQPGLPKIPLHIKASILSREKLPQNSTYRFKKTTLFTQRLAKSL